MRISKFVNNSDKTPLHSSGYIVPPSSMGSTSSETFGVRKQREHNRVHVAGYKRSIIGQPVTARKYQRPAERRTGGNSQASCGQVPPSVPQPGGFREPSGRGYNPYS